jgi:hypothetical protein
MHLLLLQVEELTAKIAAQARVEAANQEMQVRAAMLCSPELQQHIHCSKPEMHGCKLS